MTERRRLEWEISTLLQTIDTLESESENPSRRQELAPDLAQAATSLAATIETLRALPSAVPLELVPAARQGTRASGGRNGIPHARARVAAHEPSANAYLAAADVSSALSVVLEGGHVRTVVGE